MLGNRQRSDGRDGWLGCVRICTYNLMTAATKCTASDGTTHLFGDEWDDIQGSTERIHEIFVHFRHISHC